MTSEVGVKSESCSRGPAIAAKQRGSSQTSSPAEEAKNSRRLRRAQKAEVFGPHAFRSAATTKFTSIRGTPVETACAHRDTAKVTFQWARQTLAQIAALPILCVATQKLTEHRGSDASMEPDQP